MGVLAGVPTGVPVGLPVGLPVCLLEKYSDYFPQGFSFVHYLRIRDKIELPNKKQG
jgi:hypothetical protein